jgi:glutamate-1-semialdehyde 2,1-aminomutase
MISGEYKSMPTQKPVADTSKSSELFTEAKKVIPSGVSSLQRVAGFSNYPIYMESGVGSKIRDVNGNEYVDLLMGFGSLINGHSHPRIVDALKKQVEMMTLCGTPTELEIKVARKVNSMVPNADMTLFCNSGTEATMHAVRIARAVTGKDRIVKFEGGYHGQHDYVLFSVEPSETGLEISPFRVPYQPGIPEEIARTVVVAPWNNPQILEKILKRYRNDIAAIITEPIMANCGVIMPEPDYLKQLKELAEKYEALLIFDEVLTGFRIAKGGAQEYFKVNADMTVFGKALGGGVPIAAVSGKREILEMVAPGKIGFGGTYNANPLSLAGSLANLEILSENNAEAYSVLHSVGSTLIRGLAEQAHDAGVELLVQGVGPLFQLFFTHLEKIRNYREAWLADDESFHIFHEEMLKRRVYLHPDPFERIPISTAHNKQDVEYIVEAAGEAFREVQRKQA